MPHLALPLTRPGEIAGGSRPRASEAAALGGVAVLAVALGWAIARYDGFGADIGSALLLTVVVLAAAAVIRAGPAACLVAIVVLTIARYRPVLVDAGGLDVLPIDVLFVGILGWWLRGVIARGRGNYAKARPRVRFGQGVATILFAYVALTFLNIAVVDSAALGDSLVSWLRFVETAALAVLAASMIETKRQVRLVLGATVIAAAASIALPLVLAGGSFDERFGGFGLGPNLAGLVSGLVLLAGAFGAVSPKARGRVVLVAIGVLGLVLAQSVASIVGTAVALAVGAGLMSKAGAAPQATRMALAAAVVGVVAFGAVQALRPEVTPGSEGFGASSASQRMVLGAAGIEIFKRNPAIGVGWRRSNDPDVIQDPQVETAVRRRFQHFRLSHFDVFTKSNPTSVHNSYVQILAELGLAGFMLFAALMTVIAIRVRDLLRSLGRDHELWRGAWVMALAVLLCLVWHNDNPVFGGDPSTVIPAVFIGTLAALARIETAPPPPRRA